MHTRFWHLVRSDLIANRILPPDTTMRGIRLVLKAMSGSFFRPSFACVLWYRINRVLFVRRIPGYGLLNARRRYWFANDISCQAEIGPGLYLPHFFDIVIGTKAVIGSRAVIFNGVTIGTKWMHDKKMPVLGDDVVIGTGAKLLGDCAIGDRSVIGALSFVDKDIPADSTVFGIPPNRTVKTRVPESHA